MAEDWDKKILKKPENEKIKGIPIQNTSHLISKRLFYFYHDELNHGQDPKLIHLRSFDHFMESVTPVAVFPQIVSPFDSFRGNYSVYEVRNCHNAENFQFSTFKNE